MAGEWIKMRTSLMTSPKVNGIARYLETSKKACQTLSTGYNGTLSEIVTRNVTRCVTVSSLLVIWGAANEHTKDGIFHNADLSDIDDMVGIPDFGAAMESVGWAIYDEEIDAVILPNFSEYNTVGEDRKSNAADRQRRYRERKKALQSDVTSDVTRYVTSNGREEKRREEKIKDINPPNPPRGRELKKSYPYPEQLNAQAWEEWKAYRRENKFKAYSPTERSEGAAITELINLSGGDHGLQMAIVRQSMAKSWRGLFAVDNYRRDVNVIPEPDSQIPAGFRG